MTSEIECDLVVLGCGAAGMTAAAVAALEGLSVVILEKTEFVGGNTSYSGGMVYIPNNSAMAEAGEPDDSDEAFAYLEATVRTESGRNLRRLFVDKGREAIDYLEKRTALRLNSVPFYPDYYPETEGSRTGMRVLEPQAFDGSSLGRWFAKLRPPIPEFTILGGMMVSREDIPHFRKFWKSIPSTLRVMRLVFAHGWERMRHPRGTRLVLGNALAGQLLKSLLDLDVNIITEANTRRILFTEGRASGVEMTMPQGDVRIRSRLGVMLATGGFAASAEKRRQYLPEGASLHTAYAPGSTGDGLDFGVDAGGHVESDNPHNAYWCPVSIYERSDGKTVVYPHTVTDRGKPGSIVVNRSGRRFCNEAVSYHRFGEAQFGTHTGEVSIPAYLICDSTFIWRYGMGAIKPFARNLRSYQKAGYLLSSNSIVGLAEVIGVNPAEFARTIKRFNDDSRAGKDTEFQRGESIYAHYLGDRDVTPNPCLAPIKRAPFHAMALYPSDLGTIAGLSVNTNCQVLDRTGLAIPGLYAIGNDMHSIMRGHYPGPGITLGPAITFGYIAALHAARAPPRPEND